MLTNTIPTEMKKFFTPIIDIAKITFNGFGKHGVMNYSASIAYYTIFSLPGLLITIVVVAGLFLGQEAVQGQLVGQLEGYVGTAAAETIEAMLAKIQLDNDFSIQTIIGIGTLVFSATTIFISLQEALNRIWDVEAVPEKGLIKFIINRVLSFGMILSLGFILLVSFLLDTALELVFGKLQNAIGREPTLWLDIMGSILSFGVALLVVMLIFKVLPDVYLKWRDVAKGGLITTGLLILGKYLISLYIENTDFSATYDAAGSFIVILVWVYYSTLVLFFGAEITRAIMIYKGRPIRPAKGAKKIKIQQFDYDEYIKLNS